LQPFPNAKQGYSDTSAEYLWHESHLDQNRSNHGILDMTHKKYIFTLALPPMSSKKKKQKKTLVYLMNYALECEMLIVLKGENQN